MRICPTIRLEDVASLRLSQPLLLQQLFKKYQGIGFNAWVKPPENG